MIVKKESKRLLGKAVFGWLFAIITFFGFFSSVWMSQPAVYAEPNEIEMSETETNTPDGDGATEESEGGEADYSHTITVETSNGTMSEVTVVETPREDEAASSDVECKKALGAVGWLVCPATGVIAQAADFLYDMLEGILIIDPIKVEDGTPVYEIWKYCRGLTNIVFIIFLLVVIYSQITGVGITNYGIKKAIPKLIVAAVLVNLSFIICSLAVDASNIIGGGIRGLFSTVAESAVAGGTVGSGSTDMVGLFGALAGGSALTVGGVALAVQTGAIFMLIPTILGALVAILSGVITVALRQAVVILLVMIAPLAIVARILPNTEKLFEKWKSLLIRMLVFYPMFSLLFGASNLAGFAIITSASDVFGVLLGVAVQIFPLFFAWSLMKMSGTFLSDINSKMRGLADGPLATNRAWADSRRQLQRQRTLLNGNRHLPSTALMRYLEERKVAREKEISDNAEILKNRGLARHARSHYRRDGTVSRKGERVYALQAENLRNQREIAKHEHNFDDGLGGRGKDLAQTMRLKRLDVENVEASDSLKMEMARGEWIKYENAKGFYNRMEAARMAHLDEANGYNVNPENGERTPKNGYHFRLPVGSSEQVAAMSRYNTMRQIMDNNEYAMEYAAATAAHGYSSESRAVGMKFLTYYDMDPPTKDLAYRLTELTTKKDAADYIDVILPGLRVLNNRGDVDVVREQIENIMQKDDEHNGLTLGTHASQAIGNFLMFEVKDKDAWLRRFGKYINLETARMYNTSDPRTVQNVTYDEYVKGYHYEPDPSSPTGKKIMLAKKGMRELMEGTSLDGLERAAFDSYDASIREAYTTVDADGNKHLDVAEYLKKKEEIEEALNSAFISSSLKFMSGSEQLAGAVKMKAGYISKQDANTGKSYIVPMWEDPETMAKFGMTGSEEIIRKFYQRRTLKYLGDQSPNQILALRSDYKEPLMKHLYDAYVESDGADWTNEERDERDNYLEMMRGLQAEYESLPDGAEKDAVEAKMVSLKQKMVGAQFRQILNSKGKLEQIYTTRRSGAANNAKDWVREWLNLGNPREMQKVFDQNRKNRNHENEKAQHDSESDDAAETHTPFGEYNETDIDNFRNELNRIQNDMMGASMEEIYDAMTDAVERNFGGVAGQVFNDFEQYYANHQDTINQHDLAEKLIELLSRDLLQN